MSEKTIEILGIEDTEEELGVRDFLLGWNSVDIETLDQPLSAEGHWSH